MISLHYFFIFLEYCDVQRTLAGEEVRILKRRACCCALWGSRAADSLSLSYPRLTSNPISVPRVLLIARCKLFYFYQCAICEINLIPKSKGLRCNVKTYEAILLLEKRPCATSKKNPIFFKPDVYLVDTFLYCNARLKKIEHWIYWLCAAAQWFIFSSKM